MCHLLISSLERRGLSQCCFCAETFLCLSPDSTKHNQRVSQLVQYSNWLENMSTAEGEKGLTIRWPLITSSRSSSLEPSRKSLNRSTTMHGGLRCHKTHTNFTLFSLCLLLQLYSTQRAHMFARAAKPF